MDFLFAVLVSVSLRELLLYCIDLLLLSGLCRVPALFAHLGVNLILHRERVVECLSKCGMNGGGEGFHSPVHKKIAFALKVKQKIFHYFLVVHSGCSFLSSIEKPVKAVKAFGVLSGYRGDEIFEVGVGDVAGAFGAKSLDLLLVSKGVGYV